MLTRRKILGGASAGIAIASSSSVFAQTSTLSAVVTLNGQTFSFTESSGRDLGDFISSIGGFTQRCVRSSAANCPLAVYFRPDRNSERVEVVFELGACFTGSATNLGAYNVKIYRSGVLLANVEVPAHYWFSRWRWQSAPRPVVADVAALISQNLLPPYDRSAVTGGTTQTCTTTNPGRPGGGVTTCTTTTALSALSATAPALLSSVITYATMGLAGLQASMPNTGERDDIGLVTESQAQYICTGNQTALAQLRAHAEGAGTCPWHLRDENTNAPLNFRSYPDASWYSQSVSNPYIRQTISPVTLDAAHMPAVAYVPYLLTGDPYHLEDLQFMANWCWGSLPPKYRPTIAQSRQYAWYLRSLAQCVRVTPATVPSWLLPRSYWAGFLDQNRAFVEANYVNSSDPVKAVFRSTGDITAGRDEGATAPGGSWVDPWQEEFLASVLGWIVSMGFPEWRTAFDWKIGSTLARTGTTSGWVRARATPYRMILRDSATSPVARSWAEGWAKTLYIAKLPFTDPNSWVDADATYLSYSRGALVFANKLGTPMGDNLTWATNQIRSKGWKTAYKWRLGSGL